MTISWNDLFTQGTLINFSTHLWRARMRLQAKDLGIDETDEVQKAFSFGCHRLAPAKAFENINSAVNAWLTDIMEHSFAFPLLKGVRYVPDAQVPELQRKLEGHQREFQIHVEEFLAQYEDIMNEMLPTIEQALYDAAKNPEAAQTAYSRVVKEYPSVQKVAAKFGLEWDFFTISLPASKEAAQSAKNAVPQVQSIITGMIEELRGELSEKVQTLLDLTAKANEGTGRYKYDIGSRSKKSAYEVLDKVDRLNMFDDDCLKEQTQMLRRLLDNTDMKTIAKDLNKIKNNLETDISDIAKAAEKKLTGLGNRKIAV